MQTFSIHMTHTEATIRRLSKVQYNTFHRTAKAFWYTVFFCCILFGTGQLVELDTAPQILLIAIGGVGITNVGASARAKADRLLRIIQANGNQFPESEMTISPKGITVLEKGGDTPTTVKKSDVYRLVDDPQYVYIFITREAAYMLPKDQISDYKAFGETLKQATDRSIQPPFQLQAAVLGWLLGRFEKRKQK